MAEYFFTWPHEFCRWRMIVLRTSTLVNVANGSSILIVEYFSEYFSFAWRYQLKIFTVCPRTEKLNSPKFLRACDRPSSCYVCFPVTSRMSLVLVSFFGFDFRPLDFVFPILIFTFWFRFPNNTFEFYKFRFLISVWLLSLPFMMPSTASCTWTWMNQKRSYWPSVKIV